MISEITATIIADSVSQYGDRLTTLELHFPRFLLAELNTHRDFSRNSASSRARSVKKTIQEVRDDPFVPVHWPSERVGMSGGAEITGLDRVGAERLWRAAAWVACDDAEALAADGVHKSLVNRLLEPFMWHTAVVTATNWDNFFTQRLALLDDGTPAAEPHFFDLAQAMKTAMELSQPRELRDDEWHLPYLSFPQLDAIANDLTYGSDWLAVMLKVSVARCAGVSYLNQKAHRTIESDLLLYDRLRSADPPHWSPFEHVARPRISRGAVTARWYNITGWCSLRWFLENGAHLDTSQ